MIWAQTAFTTHTSTPFEMLCQHTFSNHKTFSQHTFPSLLFCLLPTCQRADEQHSNISLCSSRSNKLVFSFRPHYLLMSAGQYFCLFPGVMIPLQKKKKFPFLSKSIIRLCDTSNVPVSLLTLLLSPEKQWAKTPPQKTRSFHLLLCNSNFPGIRNKIPHSIKQSKCSVPSSHFPDFSAVTNRDSLPPGSLRFRVRRSAGECRTGPSEGRKTLSGPLDSPLSFGLFCYFPFGGFIITAIRLFVNRFLILF